jgi:tRNA-dihydrouridine synthase B
MIGRAAQGSPWIFRAVNAFLDSGKIPPPLLQSCVTQLILQHLESLYKFYGEYTGVRVARKHLGWYCQQQSLGPQSRRALMAAETSVSQYDTARRIFAGVAAAEAAA